jgi:L-alanine-DL-glutamate epimerase-like enolase superfamily enzyme
MKVTGARTVLFQGELSRALGDSNLPGGTSRTAASALILETDEGLTGLALASPSSVASIEFLLPIVIGEDPRGVRGLWQRLVDQVFKGGHVGAAAEAISAIDVALWDLKAKAAGEPLWMTLGAKAEDTRVAAYASGLDLPLTKDQLRAYYRDMAGHGFFRGKLKVGLDQDADLERLAIVREELSINSTRPALMIDANEIWSPKQAVRRITEFESQFDLTWVEEPARRWDYRGLRSVSRGVRSAVASGENLQNVSQFVPLISNEAIDIVQISSGCGGITGALQVAELANAFDLPVAFMSSAGNFLAHVAAAIPNHSALEVIDLDWHRGVVHSDVRVEGGSILLGNAPGNGLSFDEQALKLALVEKPSPDALFGGSIYRRPRGAAFAI